MASVFAVNGSPRRGKGNTAALLASFLQGMEDAGAGTDLVYPDDFKIKPCICSQIVCWNETPGECCIQDDMQQLYPRMKAAEILVLASPVYIPLPGAMQNFINRLMPLMDPAIKRVHEGRTRIQMHRDVHIRCIAMVITSGWWEKENCDTVLRIGRELAADAGIEFAGALLRPHFDSMKADSEYTPAGSAVLEAARLAGTDLIRTGKIRQETLEAVSRPLVGFEEYVHPKMG